MDRVALICSVPVCRCCCHCDSVVMQVSLRPILNWNPTIPMRRLLAVFLLLSFLCQAFAMAGQSLALGHDASFEAEHAEMHWEGVAHHHDEDGDTHQDNSSESVAHMLADAGPGTAALLPFPVLSLHVDRLPAPAVMAESAGPPPYLDGLRRPPRLLS